MDFSSPFQWTAMFSPLVLSYPYTPENYVHWTQTPESHIFSADLCGMRKEDIKVEVEDSIFLIIRTETSEDNSPPSAKSFKRKFRLPENIDINGISARYEDGVLNVTVPRSFLRRGFYIDPSDLPGQLHPLARAA